MPLSYFLFFMLSRVEIQPKEKNIRNNVSSGKSYLLYGKYHQFYFIPHLHTLSEAAASAFQNSTNTAYSLILDPQCLGGLSQTNQGRNPTSLIHNALIHFTCLLRHPTPMIYLQRWSQKNLPPPKHMYTYFYKLAKIFSNFPVGNGISPSLFYVFYTVSIII